MGEETSMAAAAADAAPEDDGVPLALTDLINVVSKAMVDAVNGDALTPHGVMFGVALALRQFSLLGQQVEGWTDAQAGEFAMDAIKHAFSTAVSAQVAAKVADSGALRH